MHHCQNICLSVSRAVSPFCTIISVHVYNYAVHACLSCDLAVNPWSLLKPDDVILFQVKHTKKNTKVERWELICKW